jgi:flagellar basal-body rod modification protein FlgD
MDAVTAATGATATAASKAKTGLADSFDTFLTLLTAQLQNQDPLKPMDSTEFTSQLVQFTSVEQQIAQNENLENILAAQRSSAASSAVGYLGKSAIANTDQAGLVNGRASWTLNLPSTPNSLDLSIVDANGRVVATGAGAIAAGEQTIAWDGKSFNGQQLPNGGVYSLRVTAKNGNGDLITPTLSQKGMISGVDLSGTSPRLTLNGTPVDIATIKSLSTMPYTGYEI